MAKCRWCGDPLKSTRDAKFFCCNKCKIDWAYRNSSGTSLYAEGDYMWIDSSGVLAINGKEDFWDEIIARVFVPHKRRKKP